MSVTPGSRRDEVVWCEGRGLRVRLVAPAADGKANRALVALLAERLGLPRSVISLVHGASSRCKLVAVAGLSTEEMHTRLTGGEASRR